MVKVISAPKIKKGNKIGIPEYDEHPRKPMTRRLFGKITEISNQQVCKAMPISRNSFFETCLAWLTSFDNFISMWTLSLFKAAQYVFTSGYTWQRQRRHYINRTVDIISHSSFCQSRTFLFSNYSKMPEYFSEDFLGDIELLPVYNVMTKGFLKELDLPFYRATGIIEKGKNSCSFSSISSTF